MFQTLRFSSTLNTVLMLCLALTASNARDVQSEASRQFLRDEHTSWQQKIAHALTSTGDSTIDVRFYELSVDIALHKKYIAGDVLVRFDALQPTNEIKLNLHHAFDITRISGNVQQYTFANDTIYIDLQQPLRAGERSEVHIFYEGVPQLIRGTKGLRYSQHGNSEPVIANLSTPYLAHYWWPCKDGPGDKPDSVYINVTIPDTTIRGINVLAISNGSLDSVSTHQNKKTFHWRERYPIVPYYVNVTISNYRIIQQWSGGKPNKGFPISYFVFDENRRIAEQEFAAFPKVMSFFSSIFGDYPFRTEKYAMSELGFYSAIEKQTNTVMRRLDQDWFIVAVHELAHMWFADMITCSSWHHGWLNEGFATYAEALWYEHSKGPSAYFDHMQDIKFLDGGSVYLDDASDPFRVFIPIIYKKGAWVLHMLRGVLGDELFFQAIKSYATDPRFMYDHADTQDFQEVCETVSGRELHTFFDQWVFDEYYPIYEYDYSVNASTVELRIEQVQGQKGWRPVFKMPVPIEITFQDGTDSLLRVYNDQSVQNYVLELDQPVASLQFDPQQWILRQVSRQTFVEHLTQQPSDPVLSPNAPNPFNAATRSQFFLPTQSQVQIDVMSMLGQHIKTLKRGVLPQGWQWVSWDGTNEQNATMSSGVYFMVMRYEEHRLVRKMLLLE